MKNTNTQKEHFRIIEIENFESFKDYTKPQLKTLNAMIEKINLAIADLNAKEIAVNEATDLELKIDLMIEEVNCEIDLYEEKLKLRA